MDIKCKLCNKEIRVNDRNLSDQARSHATKEHRGENMVIFQLPTRNGLTVTVVGGCVQIDYAPQLDNK